MWPRRIRLTVLLAAGLGVTIAAAGLSAAVVIDEIHYHPASGLKEDEFIELHNTADEPVSLGGWSFSDGVEFVFPAGSTIGGGGFLVIARDAARIRARYGLGEGLVLGDYEGALSNGGERLALSDDRGREVDDLVYLDEYPWPSEADGGGHSLECVNPRLDNSTPRNWLPSANAAPWVRVSVEGSATSSRLYLYLEGAGECLVDDLSITEQGGTENLFPAGDFEGDVSGWNMTGTHAGSFVTSEESYGGSRSLRIVATGPGSSSDTSVNRTVDALVAGQVYVLSFWAKSLGGSSSLINRLSGSGLLARTNLRGLEGTPGQVNSVRSDRLPPLVSSFYLDPALPRAGEPTRLLAIVEGEDLTQVIGLYDTGGDPRAIVLKDDGRSGDGAAGDGLFGGLLPAAPAGSIVDYGVIARDAAGGEFRTPMRRYPVDTFDVSSEIPVYHIFIRDDDWARLNADIWTDEYFPAVLVHDGEVYGDVGLRFRGGRPRLFRKKSLKLKFTSGQPFSGHVSGPRRRLNLNAAAMDDDYITEPLAYWLYAQAGVFASETRMVRVQLNGEFWGLFIDVEQVDELYLQKAGLDPEGALYKSVGVVGSLRKLDGMTYNGSSYTYQSQYEKKTREDEPYDDLIAFIHGLYDTPPSQMEEYLETHLDVDQFIRYLAATNVMCIWDVIQHNFYFYRDTNGDGKWRIIPWDNDHVWGEWEWRYYYGDTYHLLMGTESHPFAGVWYTWNRLWTVLLDVPRFRAEYYDRIRWLLNTRFAEGPLFRRIDELVYPIQTTVLLDELKWPDSLEPLHAGPMRTMAEELPLLMQNVTRRRAYLAGQLGVTLIDVPAGSTFQRGDADGSSVVDLSDAIRVLGYLFLGGEAPPCQDAADTDDTGILDVSDAVYLLLHLFAGGPPPPPPAPDGCGEDPTPDDLTCDVSTCEIR